MIFRSQGYHTNILCYRRKELRKYFVNKSEFQMRFKGKFSDNVKSN